MSNDKEKDIISFELPKYLSKAFTQFLKDNGYNNKSEYLRDILREKLELNGYIKKIH